MLIVRHSCKLLVRKLQSIHPKENKKNTYEIINYTCFKLEEKTTRSVEKNKNNFIHCSPIL